MLIRGNIAFRSKTIYSLTFPKGPSLGQKSTEGLTVQKSRQTECATQSVWEISIEGYKNNKIVSVPSVDTEADYVK